MAKSFFKSNKQLKKAAQEALENWHLDTDTDPDGRTAAGLKVALSGDLDDSEVLDAFQVDNFPKGSDKWDALEDWSRRLA